MDRQFTVNVAAYGAAPGETVTLNASDPRVQLNIAAGVLTLVKDQPPEKHPCPACAEQGVKRPLSFATSDELQAHYAEKHPGLVPPD
jgi:hypothetical protein